MNHIAKAVEEVKALLGDRLSTAPAVLNTHGENETYFPHTPPDAVAFPNGASEVSEIVKICARHNCPIVPWGVGTSLEGHALPVRGGITLNMQNMADVIEVMDADLAVRVGPGITRERLNAELRATGLFFPVDPGANASLGGMAATRASGTTTVRYGTMRENVLGLEVVLADGRILRTGSTAKKSSAGYDLTKLMIGSEGTLGIITELTLRLQGQPEAVSAAVCSFPSVADAVNTVIASVQMGISMARMELVDPNSMKAINDYSNLNYPLEPHLFLEFHGSSAGVAEQADIVGDIAAENGGTDFQWTSKTEDRTKLWHARHNAYFATKAQFPGQLGLSTDVCVPISKLAEAIAETQADLEAHKITGNIIGHVGDGNYHTLLFAPPEDKDALNLNLKLAGRMAERALRLGGTVTGEHGIGMGKMKFMEAEHGAGWQVMAEIKRALDPQNILNPGKVVEIN
ncbi:MAG: FAD-linked oxidase C-terminal domain-containing protein [Pseudomonadota bacterium]